MDLVRIASILALVGGIVSIVYPTIGILVIIATAARYGMWILSVVPVIISLILDIIYIILGGFLTLLLARKKLLKGDLKTGAIMCIIFGAITVLSIGGIITLNAGILAIIAWSLQRRAAEAPISLPPPPPPPPPPPQVVIQIVYIAVLNSQMKNFLSVIL